MDTSAQEQEVLLKIYIGQNIRKEGMLQSEINEKQQVQTLLSKGLIKENHWYLYQLLTTDEGSELGKKLISGRIKEREEQLQNNIQDIPEKAFGFFIKRYVSRKMVFSTEKPRWSLMWNDRILLDGRIWVLWDELFSALETLGLCIKTYDYVSTRGGERRDMCYVISSEIREFLVKQRAPPDFTHNQEDTLKLYPILLSANRILATDDVDYARQQCYELLKSNSITENQIAGIINDMSKNRITSEYRGLLSEIKPFDVIDPNRFRIYLDKNLIEPAVNILLEKGGEIKDYTIKEDIPSLSEVKIELGILDSKELGDFYILVSSLERQLREFIKEKLGIGWMKRIENDFPDIARDWEEKSQRDKKWGIEPEKDLMSYADLGDYVQVIKKYKRMFSDGDEDLGSIIAHLQIWYNHGRNPIMHARTVNQQKYFTTKSAVEFLHEWMHRKRS